MVSRYRLYALRAAYAMITIFISTSVWPILVTRGTSVRHMHGVALALLCALAPVMLIGVWKPLQMLPAMLFEFAWKLIWVSAIGVPLWRAGMLDANTAATLKDCGVGVVICLVVIPWPYVFRTYLRRENSGVMTAEAARF
jgi:hypothetical protein